MKKAGLNPMNVENALETLWNATSIDTEGEVATAYWVIKEFIQVVKEEVVKDDVGVLLTKRK